MKIGDIVCYRASFLRSVGWFTDVPPNGKVVEILEDEKRVKIEWSDGSHSRLLESNIILESKKHLERV